MYKRKKPNGKVRIIHAPKPELKCAQAWLARVYELGFEPLDCVHGFLKGRSPATLAKNHVGKDWVVTIDIRDFFPSITKSMLIEAGASLEHGEIATLDDRLVQGSPCSPIFSNLVFIPLDRIFSSFFKRKKVRYDRYADDIVISGNGKPSWTYVNYIKAKCLDAGFVVNTKKIKFMFKNQEQNVLGITVNTDVSINSKTRKALKNKMKYEGVTEKEKGYLSYIHSINKEQYDRLKILT